MSTEQELEAEIKEYSEQLENINKILGSSSGPVTDKSSELTTLKSDLEQLIELSKESLLDLKKKNLLEELDLLTDQTNHNDRKSDKEDSNDIVASKVRVYYECPNTNLKMHNALVLGLDDLEEQTVKVLFCNPTHRDMKICEHFMNEACKFEGSCKYSHGYSVKVDDLSAYLEPKFEGIKIGLNCLAKHTDELWHLAFIESIDREHICVQFKKFNLATALKWEDVLLLDELNEDESDSSDSDLSGDEFTFEDEQPCTSKNLENLRNSSLGAWEKHTRGIGSKLMAKMGYIAGKGLGKQGEGRIEPVEAEVTAEGNLGLDGIMEKRKVKQLKDLKLKKKANRDVKSTVEEKPEINVFDFINTKLSNQCENETLRKKVPMLDFSVYTKSYEQTPRCSGSLASTGNSTKDLNIQMLQTHNQIQTFERTVAKYRESLVRNKNADKATVASIKKKLDEAEDSLACLRRSESAIQNEKSSQKKKRDIF